MPLAARFCSALIGGNFLLTITKWRWIAPDYTRNYTHFADLARNIEGPTMRLRSTALAIKVNVVFKSLSTRRGIAYESSAEGDYSFDIVLMHYIEPKRAR